MASRIFQLGIVFAIGLSFGPTSSAFVRAVGISEIPLSIQLKNPYDVIVRKGQSAILKCEVKSSSAELQITWLHNDSPVPTNDSRRILQNDGSLLITKVVNGKKMISLTGEYRCIAKNNIGSIISNPAKLTIASFDRDFIRQPTNISVPEFQPVVLFCNIHSIPTAQIQWEYNTSPLPHSTRYVPLPTGALLITKTLSSDEGLYRCIATNSILKKIKYSKIVKLTVLSSMIDPVAPTFLPLDILPNKTVLIGDNVNLYCAVSGWPIPSVQWLNNRNIVVDNSNSTVLQLNNVTINDSGIYICSTSNQYGQIKQHYLIDIEQKPYFNVTPNSTTFPSARTIRLNCQSRGIPEPKISWFKDGQPLVIEGRIKQQVNGLVISQSFSYDSGMYQCVAINRAGVAWTAAQLVLITKDNISTAENVHCRSYDNTSICLTWQPPTNVAAQAYSIYAYYTVMGHEIPAKEYVTNVTNYLADKLNSSTNYTFYVRSYSTTASDKSAEVTCETVVKGKRNLQISVVGDTSVELKWSKISIDTTCNGTKELYKVQWKRMGHSSVNINITNAFSQIITGLLPSVRYEFRVNSMNYKAENAPWTVFVLTPRSNNSNNNNNNNNNNNKNDETTKKNLFDSNNTDNNNTILTPNHLEANPSSSRSINVSWESNAKSKFFTLCYKPIDNEENICEYSNVINSSSNSIQVNKLQPNTVYEFKVRSHSSNDDFSPYSSAIEVQTPPEVPSPVLDLEYKIVNDTTVCLRWHAPEHENGVLKKYFISYTPDSNWPPDKWISLSVPSSQRLSAVCWLGEEKTISTLLIDLIPSKKYMVIVQAQSNIGLSNPTEPILVTTNQALIVDETDEKFNSINTRQYNQKLGIIMGVSIAIVCIIFCISCILVRKQCLKRREMLRSRLAATTNNYYPAVAHYTTQGSSVQVRLEDPCSADVHEIEHLFNEEQPPHIPAITLTHLDTKGNNSFPNGNIINGSTKPYMNGHIIDNDNNVHITENPQYIVFETNGRIGNNDLKQPDNYYDSSQFEEDSNSNIKTSNIHRDLHKIYKHNQT